LTMMERNFERPVAFKTNVNRTMVQLGYADDDDDDDDDDADADTSQLGTWVSPKRRHPAS